MNEYATAALGCSPEGITTLSLLSLSSSDASFPPVVTPITLAPLETASWYAARDSSVLPE